MNSHNIVPAKMEYIQKVFLGVRKYMEEHHEPEELIAHLDTEPPEFRSVAYESASMEVGLLALSCGTDLNTWKKFHLLSAKAHSFHLDIGLGWAIAKAEIAIPYPEFLYPVMSWMVFDGIGYYHGLFNGRRTVRKQLIPGGIDKQHLHGFDQGLGRRLWYISKGDVEQLSQLLHSFHLSRQADLWQGVGIACGYVGGNDRSNLEKLLNHSTIFKDRLCTGISFAAVSRKASNSITEDIELTCEIVCEKSLSALLSDEQGIKDQFDSMLLMSHIN